MLMGGKGTTADRTTAVSEIKKGSFVMLLRGLGLPDKYLEYVRAMQLAVNWSATGYVC